MSMAGRVPSMPMDCLKVFPQHLFSFFGYTQISKTACRGKKVGSFDGRFRNQWEFIDGFSLYSAAMLRPRWFDHLGKVGDLHTHSFCPLADDIVNHSAGSPIPAVGMSRGQTQWLDGS